MKDIGKIGEQLAKKWLIRQGFLILQQNFKLSSIGEIDLVAQKDNKIHFIEVKTLSASFELRPEDHFNKTKFLKIVKLGRIFMIKNKLEDEWQIDLIAIEIQKISQNKIKYKLRYYPNVSLDEK